MRALPKGGRPAGAEGERFPSGDISCYAHDKKLQPKSDAGIVINILKTAGAWTHHTIISLSLAVAVGSISHWWIGMIVGVLFGLVHEYLQVVHGIPHKSTLKDGAKDVADFSSGALFGVTCLQVHSGAWPWWLWLVSGAVMLGVVVWVHKK